VVSPRGTDFVRSSDYALGAEQFDILLPAQRAGAKTFTLAHGEVQVFWHVIVAYVAAGATPYPKVGHRYPALDNHGPVVGATACFDLGVQLPGNLLGVAGGKFSHEE
jgi:microcystin-dependent protein